MVDKAEQVREVFPDFVCPITHAIMQDPVIYPDGVTYERAAIEAYLAEHEESPTTSQPMQTGTGIPNIALRNTIRRALSAPVQKVAEEVATGPPCGKCQTPMPIARRGAYRCDGCRGRGCCARYRCAGCDFDLCWKCAPLPKAKIAVSEGIPACAKCGEAMKLGACGGYVCDSCGAGRHGNRYRCGECDFDICPSCFPVPKVEVVLVEGVPQCAKCGKKTSPGTTYMPYTCDLCRGFGHGRRFRCKSCDFDVCQSCAAPVVEVVLTGGIPACVVCGTAMAPYTGRHGYCCDSCKVHGGKEQRFRCCACDFDLCPRCAPIVASEHPVQPASEQPASEQPASEQPASEQPASEQPASEQPASEPVLEGQPCGECGKPTTFQIGGEYGCDRCRAMRGASGRFACRECNFDLCLSCHAAPPVCAGCRAKLAIVSGPAYRCASCGANGGTQARFACLACGFNLCHACAPTGAAVARVGRSPACGECGGPMTIWARGKYTCDLCEAACSDDARWRCHPCNFDLCHECAAVEALVCGRCGLPMPIISKEEYRCDQCGVSRGPEPRFCCNPCHFDLCHSCAPLPGPATCGGCGKLLEITEAGPYGCDGCRACRGFEARYRCAACDYDLCHACAPLE